MPQSEETRMALMAQQISTIEKTVGTINEKLDKNYITKDQLAIYTDKLDRLEKIIYGVIMAILIALVGFAFTFLKK